MKKIKKGDEIIVITGKDKGKKGKVLSVLTKSERLIVEGINLASKCIKPDPNKGSTGGITKIEMSIHQSNVKLIDSSSNAGTRVGFRVMENGQRVRYFKKSNQLVES